MDRNPRPLTARGSRRRRFLLAAVAIAAAVLALSLEPIPQDPAYHEFADRRALLGIRNFWNVITNVPFIAIGGMALAWRSRLRWIALRGPYLLLCVGIALVGFGSAYYHRAPSTATLVWDRLPMTVAFMALFAAVIQERVSERWGRVLLWPLVAAGVASIAWWHWSELAGRGDLRPYALVQFMPMLLVPLMVLLFPGQGLRDRDLWAGCGAYLLAKLAEYFDGALYEATGLLSGHSLKHLLAALAAGCLAMAFVAQRSPARAL